MAWPNRRPGTAVGVAALLAALAVLCGGGLALCGGGVCRVPAWDAALLATLDAVRSPVLDRALHGLTWLGSIAVLLPLALVAALADARRGGAAPFFVPAALLGAWALSFIAKTAIARPRPDAFAPLIALPADASFPSGHAMQAAAFVAALLLRPGARPGVAAALVGAASVGAVAVSRPYLQVHYPSDVLAGVLAGALWAVALRRLWPPPEGAR